ncbi:MAG: PAS domain S-box protein [Leptospiraceae bacterium]|nr:PAS domain S-box protein [Leptospiraceae bacterium]MCP5497099.1 PAS domain S-box protein [Leptospiraceae bacterium]
MENKEKIISLYNRAKEILDGTEIHSNPKLKALLEDTTHLITECSTFQTETEIFNSVLKQSRKSLSVERKKYKDLYDYAPVAYITLNQKGEIIQLNHETTRLFQTSRESFQEKSLFHLIDNNSKSSFSKILNDAFTNRKRQIIEVTFLNQNNQPIYTKVHLAIFYDGDLNEDLCWITITDITSQKKAENALLESEKKYRLLAENSSDTVALYEENRIKYVSPSFKKIFGFEEDEIINIDFAGIVSKLHPDDRLRIQNHILESRKNQVPTLRYSFRILTKQGEYIWIEDILKFEYDKDGNHIRTFINGRNITERKKIEEDLERAKNEAEIANQIKSDFIANISHQIQTPLNIILGFTELLKEKLENFSEYEEYFRGILNSGKNLLHLIDNILDFSKAESGQLVIKEYTMSVYSFVMEIKQIFQLEADQKNIEFSVDITSDFPEYIIVDEVRLRQILLNVVGNAIQFTELGSVNVSIALLNIHKEANTIDFEITVKDSGIGIKKNETSLIFQPFYQNVDVKNDHQSGTGLGLSITKKLVEAMGGNIEVKSTIGKGSEFIISFQNILVSESQKPIWYHEKEGNDSNKQTYQTKTEITAETSINNNIFNVLIVDDTPQIIQIIGDILKKRNINSYAALSGKKALQILSEAKIDLVLLDIFMPEMNGYEVCKIIKENPLTNHIPIIFITALSHGDNIKKGFECGAVDYVTKPFNISELMQRIQTHLKLKRSQEIIQDQNESLAKQNKQLKELLVTKDNIFSIISHDLKSPLASILGTLELLVRNNVTFNTQEREETLILLHNSAKQTFNLLENLLVWARIQSNKTPFNPVAIDMAVLLGEIVMFHRFTMADKKDISIHFQTNKNNVMIFADLEMVKTIFRNILTNAIKFTPKGGSVTLGYEPDGEMIRFFVRDTGVGMTEEKIEKIFLFEDINSTIGTDGERGTGLGFIITKEFVTKNGGEIWVESKPDKGSAVYVLLKKHK